MLIKPAGSLCNRRCSYCFYTHPEQRHRMDDEVLEAVVRRVCESPGPLQFIWQGGEPLLMGLPFFERAMALQARHSGGRPVENVLQTNGVLLDDDWGPFLREHDFLLGVSLDGPRAVHERYRPGSFDGALEGLEVLKRHGVPYNLLAVVGQHNVEKPQTVYRFLRDLGQGWLQFIPLVGVPEAATAAQLGDFWVAVFDAWQREDLGQVHVRLFEDAAAAWAGSDQRQCVFSERCATPVVEHDGSVYACDHAVDPEHRVGSLLSMTVDEVHTGLQAFSADKAAPACEGCPWHFACQGGCPLHRREGISVLCEGYKRFYRHADPALRYLVWLASHGRRPEELRDAPALHRWGRQLPCRCGSGRKLKSCCGVHPAES